jgi:multidrug efflux pump subunit AcrB
MCRCGQRAPTRPRSTATTPNEIGLAVLATTLSIVRCSCRGLAHMGGTAGKFFHEFGLTIVAAVLD